MDVSSDNWWSRIQVIDDRKGICEEIQISKFATETAEQNTSKQVSAKGTALRNVYKYAKFFFFELDVILKERSRGNGVTVFQGYNGPGLAGY